MFTLLFRKMRNTKWMVLCLLIGFIMASAMMSTIPIYMNASLQRMLVKDMEAFQLENEIYPGAYNTSYSVTLDISADKQRKEIDSVSSLVAESYNDLDCPILTQKKYISDEYLYVTTIEAAAGESASRLTLGAMTGIDEHIAVKSGRMYDKNRRSDGVYEVITTEKALKVSGLVTGTVYEIANVLILQLQ